METTIQQILDAMAHMELRLTDVLAGRGGEHRMEDAVSGLRSSNSATSSVAAPVYDDDASASVPPNPVAVIADNWGGCFDGEQYSTRPSVVADNWGGFFGGEDLASSGNPTRFILPIASTDEPSIDTALARAISKAADDSVFVTVEPAGYDESELHATAVLDVLSRVHTLDKCMTSQDKLVIDLDPDDMETPLSESALPVVPSANEMETPTTCSTPVLTEHASAEAAHSGTLRVPHGEPLPRLLHVFLAHDWLDHSADTDDSVLTSMSGCTKFVELQLRGVNLRGCIPDALFDVGLETLSVSSHALSGVLSFGSTKLAEMLQSLDLSVHQLTCGILTEMSLFFKLCVDMYCAIPADLCESVTQGVVPAGEDKDDPKQLWHHLRGRWPSDQQKPHLRSQTQHTQRHHRATAAEERTNYLSGLIPKLVKPNSVAMVTIASKPTSYSIDAQVVFNEMQQGFRTWIQRQPDTRCQSCCPSSLIDALLGGCSSIGAHCVCYLLKEYALATKLPDWLGCTQSQKLRSYRGNIPGLRPIPWPSFILLSRENKLTKSSVMVTASAIQAFVNLVLTPCDAGYSIVMSAPNYFITYMSFQMTGVIDILVGGCDSRTLHHDVDWLEKVLKDKEHVPKLVTVLNSRNPSRAFIPRPMLERISDLCKSVGQHTGLCFHHRTTSGMLLGFILVEFPTMRYFCRSTEIPWAVLPYHYYNSLLVGVEFLKHMIL
jgi:hypothetical protein